MCWGLYVGSDKPIPVSKHNEQGLHEREWVYLDGDNRPWRDCENIVAAMPEANHFYALGGCMCYLRYWDDAAIADRKAEYEGYEEYLEGVNAFNAEIARILTESLRHAQVWMLWVFEGDQNKPECSHWTLSPSHFLHPAFDMPRRRCLITLVPDGEPRAEVRRLTDGGGRN